MRLPDAWKPVEPEWTPMGGGVRWLLKRPDGAVKTMVAADVATAMARVYEGMAGLEALGMDPEADLGGSLSLERLSGYASVLTGCLYARHCLIDWQGMVDPETEEPLDHTDPDNIRAALLHGAPPQGSPQLSPFLAWLEAPRRPMAKEAYRLRQLAADHWGGGAERCRACLAEGDACAKGQPADGQVCPKLLLAPAVSEAVLAWEIASTTSGLWVRAGMDGVVVGLDYHGALLAFEAAMGDCAEPLDFGAAFTALRAIEGGRLQAAADAAKAKAEG